MSRPSGAFKKNIGFFLSYPIFCAEFSVILHFLGSCAQDTSNVCCSWDDPQVRLKRISRIRFSTPSFVHNLLKIYISLDPVRTTQVTPVFDETTLRCVLKKHSKFVFLSVFCAQFLAILHFFGSFAHDTSNICFWWDYPQVTLQFFSRNLFPCLMFGAQSSENLHFLGSCAHDTSIVYFWWDDPQETFQFFLEIRFPI